MRSTEQDPPRKRRKVLLTKRGYLRELTFYAVFFGVSAQCNKAKVQAPLPVPIEIKSSRLPTSPASAKPPATLAAAAVSAPISTPLRLPPPPFNKKKQVLYDSRQKPKGPDPYGQVKAYVAEKALLAQLFPKYLVDRKDCKEIPFVEKKDSSVDKNSTAIDEMYLVGGFGLIAAPRISADTEMSLGQFLASAKLSVDGFFTRNDVLQRAYLIEIVLCSTLLLSLGEGDTPAHFLLVVATNGKVDLKSPFERSRRLIAIDVDQDGLDEVLGIYSYGGGGEGGGDALVLYRYNGREFVREGAPREVSDADSCQLPNPHYEESVLYFLPTKQGKMPTITVKKIVKRLRCYE